MTRSQSGHDTLCAIVALHRPFSALSLRDRPAQLGQSIRSPERAPGGTAMSCPQSGQRTVIIASEPEQTLELSAVEADHDLVSDEDDGHGRPAGPRQQLCSGAWILGDVLRLKRHTFLRKKLFR